MSLNEPIEAHRGRGQRSRMTRGIVRTGSSTAATICCRWPFAAGCAITSPTLRLWPSTSARATSSRRSSISSCIPKRGEYTYLGFHEYGWPTAKHLTQRPVKTDAGLFPAIMQGIRADPKYGSVAHGL